MRTAELLVLLFSFKTPMLASAQLVERQEQGGYWPDVGVGELFWDGVNFLHGVGNFFQDPQDSDSSKTNPPPATDTPSDKKTSPEVGPASLPSADTSPAERVYKLKIDNDASPSPPSDPGPNPVVLPSVNEECDPTNLIEADCGKTIDQLIFTSGCASISPDQVVAVEAAAQNQVVQEKLAVMNGQNILAGRGGPGLRISTSDICGVFLFAVPLTEEQIQEIKQHPGVKSVRPNQDLHMPDVPENSNLEDSDPAQPPALTAPGNRLVQRDRIIVDPFAGADLRFISTPRHSELSTAYFYYSNAGQDVVIFAVDSGVNMLHDEFVTLTGESALLEDRIYAIDTVGLADDYDNLGTCRTSKMVGRTCGVARKAKVLVTMVSPKMSSLLDVFVQVANYLNNKIRLGNKTRGYYVMSIMLQWDNEDPATTNEFERLLKLLIEHYQLVVVVQAGIDNGNRNADINEWPATAERRYDIIVVGAVEVTTGRMYPFSRAGPFLSVTAPGSVKCARNRAGSSFTRRLGTDVATAEVAALVAYLLSLSDVGPRLRRNPTLIPREVKNYIMTAASYPRLNADDVPAIWNLLGTFSR